MTEAPNQRTFTLNSKEFYEAVTPPPDPWRGGPGLPREPRARDQQVIIESRNHRLPPSSSRTWIRDPASYLSAAVARVGLSERGERELR